ncbi:hypothetical protein [Sphingomonas japonica]|uniref:Uncharacterized protein n=1 Tax=Sphingomonas japonica TaxID=511662 RepID=A0ABX0U1L3_9SPHN|nr:hypothetical protein [Sphingomonas japonica]NIJ23231.1 hypothetical protein [Sphingomonas japonica]
MIRRVIGALVGREIDRRDGSGGVKGAAIGWAATSMLTRMGPLGMALGGAYVGKKMYDRHKQRRRGRVAPGADL